MICGRAGGAVARKLRKRSRNTIFGWFRGVEFHVFGENNRNRRKIIELRAGPTPIDPRGHDGVKSLEICSYLVVELWGICVFEILNVTFLPGASTSAQKPTTGRWDWPKSTLAVPTEPEFLKSVRIWWEFLSKTPSGPNRPPYRDNGRAGETVWPVWNSSKNFQNESKLNLEL